MARGMKQKTNIEDKFKAKYRVQSARLKNWDYTSNGYYYVTICTYERIEYFGKIKNGVVMLSDIGKIADTCWLSIPEYFPFASLDGYVIMPNHIHGIIAIDNGTFRGRDAIYRVSNPSHMRSNSLSKIIRWYKGRVTIETNIAGGANFYWQSRFYDHVIRNDKTLGLIRKYVTENPLCWNEDEDNAKNKAVSRKWEELLARCYGTET